MKFCLLWVRFGTAMLIGRLARPDLGLVPPAPAGGGRSAQALLESVHLGGQRGRELVAEGGELPE